MEMRERINDLINRINEDLGLGLDNDSQAHKHAMGGGRGFVKRRTLWVKKGKEPTRLEFTQV